jgi:hypothetical protein
MAKLVKGEKKKKKKKKLMAHLASLRLYGVHDLVPKDSNQN